MLQSYKKCDIIILSYFEEIAMKRFNKVYLEISNVCNLKCAFCPGTKRRAKIMDEQMFTILLKKLQQEV